MEGLLKGLGEDELAAVLSRFARRRFQVGATVLAWGETSQELYIIESGTAEILLHDRDGRERAINRLGAGSTLGEMSLFTNQPASATVRAITDLEVLALNKLEFLHVASAYPRIYHNLGTILCERLARTNRLSVNDPPGQLALLQDRGAPPLLGYALACSLAWHTRTAVLLLVVADRFPPELAARAAGADGALRAGVPTARAHLLLQGPTGRFAPEALPRTVDELAGNYRHVLIQGDEKSLSPLAAVSRRVVLAGSRDELAGTGKGICTVCGWAEGSVRERPDAARVLRVAALGPADQEMLGRGLLGQETPAGRSLGWAARDLAGLKVGVALGGGVERGYSHIGVLKVLTRMKLPIDYVVGTSIGAVVGTLFAMGFDLDVMPGMIDEVGDSLYRLTIPTASFLSNSGLKAGLRRTAGTRRIEDLERPLAITAVDLATGGEVVFRNGLIWPAVLASVSLPGIFPPLQLGPHTLVDGGVLHPVPTKQAADMGADKVIAVKLANTQALPPLLLESAEADGRPPWAIQTILRSIDLMYYKIEYVSADTATILIEPDFRSCPSCGLRQFKKGRAYIQLGEAAAEAALPRLSAAFPWLRC